MQRWRFRNESKAHPWPWTLHGLPAPRYCRCPRRYVHVSIGNVEFLDALRPHQTSSDELSGCRCYLSREALAAKRRDFFRPRVGALLLEAELDKLESTLAKTRWRGYQSICLTTEMWAALYFSRCKKIYIYSLTIYTLIASLLCI